MSAPGRWLKGKNPMVWHVYHRPAGAVPLDVAPVPASWDAAGTRSQAQLSHFLDHAQSIATPMLAAAGRSPLALELMVGLPRGVPLISGGRDLDNYLLPLVTRLDVIRFAAVFGRKFCGRSFLAVGPAQPAVIAVPPPFTTRTTGSYVREEWKWTLRNELLRAGVRPVQPGPVAIEIALTSGPSRNWANLWKPLLDAFGPVLGDSPRGPFHPYDDRITSLGLHHHIDTTVGHDVIITAWWNTAAPTP